MNRSIGIRHTLRTLRPWILAALFAGIISHGLTMQAAGRVVDSVLYIPAGTKAVEPYQYAGRDDFHTVRFEKPCRLRQLGTHAFESCGRLREINLPAGLDDIASQAFAYDSLLRTVSIPESVRHIGSNAFAFCRKLTTVTLPGRLKEIESYAFCECSELEEITFPANSNMLGEMILWGCRKMRNVIVPSVTPPTFDCNSQLFDLEEDFIYDRCTLTVPVGSERRYAAAPGWSLFRHIQPIRQHTK